ncbi:hypothetical protein LPJ79_003035 [Coemansia sp. RSA 1821]|nr:hypothetical protein LPJ79_003035 [Coemansia sp. RSA 1821]
MRKILRQRTQSGASSGTNLQALAASAGARRPRTASDEVSRRSNTARPTTDILSHLQELKAKERQVLGRGPRDTASAGSTNAAGQKQNLSAEELKSRQERQAHEERMASQYRQQLNARMREINESAIDLSHQKTVMAQLERQLLGSSSPRDLEQLELDRVNGIRSLIGLPALPPLPALGGVRQSRPGTPVYVASPYSLPSPSSSSMHGHSQKHSSYRRSHQRTISSSTGDIPRHQAAGSVSRQQDRAENHPGVTEDDEEQDMDLEEGEISEEGEILE